MTIVGTRPELIKMSRVIAALDKQMNHLLVHTGQNHDFELNQIFFEDLEIRRPDFFLNAAGTSAISTISNVLVKIDEILESENPDAVLIYGDTNSCLAVIPAKRRKIPIFHMEAGNRAFDLRIPEEINRKIVDHLSDVNLVLTEHARRYLLDEGLPPELIFKTGSHMREVFDFYQSKIEKSIVLQSLNIKKKGYLLVSLHREENIDDEKIFEQLPSILNGVAERFALPLIVSTHPRTHLRLQSLGENCFSADVRFLKPFSFTDYACLQINAYCVLSDSGTITEEASLLRFPAVTLRNAHERPEGMDSGVLVIAALKLEKVIDAIELAVCTKGPLRDVCDYQNLNVSSQIVQIVLSYTDYINRIVWHKTG
jgi:UDP-N-acetylglucosamine 2-epimerase (non-hydrolysing)